MASATVIKKADVPPKEPVYNASDQAVDDPVQACPLKKAKDNVEEKIPRIKRCYFMDINGDEIKEITKEKSVNFGLETEHMVGEKVLIDLSSYAGEFEYERQKLDKESLLKIDIGEDFEVIPLKVLSKPNGTPPSKIRKPLPPTPKKPLPPTPTKSKSNIVSVEFLDGDDTTTVSGTVDQFVNLPREEKWVDNKTIKNIDRLSNKPRILVKFDTKGKHRFSIKFKEGVDNIKYSDDEKGRNGNFKFIDSERNFTTDEDGTKIITNLKVNVAGNNEFEVIAKDRNGNEVASGGKVKVKRFFYIQELKMKGLTSCAENLTRLTAEYERNHIQMENLGSQEMEAMVNISDSPSDIADFVEKIEKAIDKSKGNEKKKHCISIAYSDHLAVKNPNQLMRTNKIKVGPGERNVVVDIKAPGKKVNDTAVAVRSLWNNIVKDEGWFVSCFYQYNKNQYETSTEREGSSPKENKGHKKELPKTPSFVKIEIPIEKCIPIPCTRSNIDDCEKVSINVSSLPKGEGKIFLRVNVVDRFRAGLASGRNPYVIVCTKAWWVKESPEDQNDVAIHEIGHKVHMVANGENGQPDKVVTHYNDEKGHVGDHCFYGNGPGATRYDTDIASKNSKCVMYGATNGKHQFCRNCSKAIRKVDLSDGF